MRIIHHIGASASGKEVDILKDAGIVIPDFKSDAITDAFYFDLEESSDQYKRLRPYIIEFKLFDSIYTEFTHDEINSAEILVTNAKWCNGYPQPQQDFIYLNTTYEYPSEACKNCNIGKVQKESFRVAKAPNWGNKKIFHLYWVYDAFFVPLTVYETVFKKYNILSKPVFLYKTGQFLKDTVQLVLPITESDLMLDSFDYEIDKVCGKKKYAPYFKGFFPNFKSIPKGLHMWQSKEWFGSGGESFRRTFITQELRQELVGNKFKMDFIPVSKEEI